MAKKRKSSNAVRQARYREKRKKELEALVLKKAKVLLRKILKELKP